MRRPEASSLRAALVVVLLLAVAVPAVPATHAPPCSDTDPVNDCMANATVLTTNFVDLWQDSTNAGVEPHEPGVGPDNQHTIWYTFTPIRASDGSFGTGASEPTWTAHGVYERQDDGSLLMLDFVYEPSGMPWSYFLCEGGRTYYVQVGVSEGLDGGRMNLYGNPCQLQPEAPAAPDLRATLGAEVGDVVLSWTAPDDGGSPITGYTLDRYLADCWGASARVADLPASATGYVEPGLAQGRHHCYALRAVNAVGLGAEDLASSPARGHPGAPRGLAAANGAEQIGLSWVSPSVTGGAPIVAYRIYVGEALHAETTATSYVDGSLPDGTSRTYTVRAVNAHGEGLPASASGRAWSVPSVARDVDAGPAFPTGVQVRWAAPADDGGAAITKYEILRGPKGGALGPIGTAPAGARSFRDSPPLLGSFDYAVVAWNARGPSPDSARSCGEQLPVPRTIGGC